MVSQFNVLAHWTAAQVMHQNLDRRILLVEHVLAVAERCFRIRNYFSCFAIISGLRSPPVQQLRHTWARISSAAASSFETLEKVFSSNDNFAVYRKVLDKTDAPCIPFFGVYLRDLAAVDAQEENMLQKDIINFSKYAKMADVVRQIKRFKACPYNFQEVPPQPHYCVLMLAVRIINDRSQSYYRSFKPAHQFP